MLADEMFKDHSLGKPAKNLIHKAEEKAHRFAQSIIHYNDWKKLKTEFEKRDGSKILSETNNVAIKALGKSLTEEMHNKNIENVRELFNQIQKSGNDQEQRLAVDMLNFIKNIFSNSSMGASMPDLYECSRRVQEHFPVLT